jgi:glycine/D-amino acid oxidase-like deaminating enzyme
MMNDQLRGNPSMDLKSGYPFWAVKNGLMRASPPLQDALRCEVAVIGGGITGALVADELQQHGFEVAVIEQRDIGWGSTAASTALLQYEIDTHLVDLAKQYGEKRAVLAYRACAEAITQLQALAGEVRDVDFAMQDSLYYASRFWHAGALREECALRARHGFDVRLLESAPLREQYGIQAPCAILSGLAARVDPYRLAHRLLERLVRRGGQVFDRSTIASLQPRARGVTLTTADGVSVRCDHVVLAAGYASQQWLRQSVASNRSSYAFISDPIAGDALGSLANTLVWESARPYLYMRSTGDGRLLVGGGDDSIDIPARRDRRVDAKARALARRVRKMFPSLPLQPAFSWAGTFAETEDGLPYFGPHRQYGPRVHFAMAYGGNGITYSVIGATLLRCLIQRRRHPLANFFSFERT